MKKLLLALVAATCAVAGGCEKRPAAGTAVEPSHVEKPWVVLNLNSGDCLDIHTQRKGNVPITREYVVQFVDGFLRGQVTHFFVNPHAMTALYPSKYYEQSWKIHERLAGTCQLSKIFKGHDDTIRKRKQMMLDGIDPAEIGVERARAKGISPWVSMRMNDLHDFYYEGEKCTMSDLWRKHPEWRRTPGAEPGQVSSFELAYSYTCKEVRDFNLGALKEMLARYDIDGVELDWMRMTYVLPAGKERENAHCLTEFMREARKAVEAEGLRKGRKLLVAARVPPRPEIAREYGYDFEAWAKEGLVDVLIPCNWWVSADYAEPIAEWRALLDKVNPKVRLVAGQDDGYSPEGDYTTRRGPTRAERFGWLERALSEGADGFYFFNFCFSLIDESNDMLVSDEPLTCERIAAGPRAYPLSYVDDQHNDGKMKRSPFPCEIGAAARAFTIPCGTRPADGTVDAVLAFAARPRESTLKTVTLNGVAATDVADLPKTFFYRFDESKIKGTCVLKFTFPLSALKRGANVVAIGGDGRADGTLHALELEVFPQSVHRKEP